MRNIDCKSGKTIIVASTEGNKTVKDNIKLGINCYKSETM